MKIGHSVVIANKNLNTQAIQTLQNLIREVQSGCNVHEASNLLTVCQCLQNDAMKDKMKRADLKKTIQRVSKFYKKYKR